VRGLQFHPLAGSTKKGNNHIIHNVKLIKINGSVLSMNISYSSRHLAVGSDQGYVSLQFSDHVVSLCFPGFSP
jgi:hypothetical protein